MTALPFWLPLPLLGIPPWMIFLQQSISLLYQFCMHTERIDRLPAPVEWVFNTPSHHRVHHGANAEYLDRNYGGILIVWDRLFGTFEPETRPRPLRADEEHRHLQPAAGRHPRVRRDLARRAAGAALAAPARLTSWPARWQPADEPLRPDAHPAARTARDRGGSSPAGVPAPPPTGVPATGGQQPAGVPEPAGANQRSDARAPGTPGRAAPARADAKLPVATVRRGGGTVVARVVRAGRRRGARPGRARLDSHAVGGQAAARCCCGWLLAVRRRRDLVAHRAGLCGGG